MTILKRPKDMPDAYLPAFNAAMARVPNGSQQMIAAKPTLYGRPPKVTHPTNPQLWHFDLSQHYGIFTRG